MFHQRGAIIRGRRLIEGRLLFEGIRYLSSGGIKREEARFFPTAVLPVIKVTYVSSCSFPEHVYHKFPGVKFVVSAKKL